MKHAHFTVSLFVVTKTNDQNVSFSFFYAVF